jgi:hypothetical protein
MKMKAFLHSLTLMTLTSAMYKYAVGVCATIPNETKLFYRHKNATCTLNNTLRAGAFPVILALYKHTRVLACVLECHEENIGHHTWISGED